MATKLLSNRWVPFLMRFGESLHQPKGSETSQAGGPLNPKTDSSMTAVHDPVGTTRVTGVGRETTDDD